MNYKKMSKEEYFALPGLSRSWLGKFIEGPDVYKAYQEEPEKESTAMKTGTFLHDYILDREAFDQKYIIAPEGMKFNVKSGLDFKRLHPDKIIINHDQGVAIQKQSALIYNNPYLSELLSDAVFEPVGQWEQDGVLLKTMPDIYNPRLKVLADIKTIGMFREDKFFFAIMDRYYDLQAKMAMDYFTDCTQFWMIFVSKKRPFRLRIWKMSVEQLNRAGALIHEYLPKFKECLDTDKWETTVPQEPTEGSGPMTDRRMVDEEENYYE